MLRAVFACVVALRDTDTIFFDAAFVVAVRTVLGWVALRDTGLDTRLTGVFVVRAVVVLRAFARDAPVVRLTVVLLVRPDATVLCGRTYTVFVDVVERVTFEASRTVALATPIPVEHAAINSQNFFILVSSMITNNCKSGQGLFEQITKNREQITNNKTPVWAF